jgi:hypothetical protein
VVGDYSVGGPVLAFWVQQLHPVHRSTGGFFDPESKVRGGTAPPQNDQGQVNGPDLHIEGKIFD